MRTEEYFLHRSHRANRAETLRILEKAGKGNPPIEGDEFPADWSKQKKAMRTANNKPRKKKRGASSE